MKSSSETFFIEPKSPHSSRPAGKNFEHLPSFFFSAFFSTPAIPIGQLRIDVQYTLVEIF